LLYPLKKVCGSGGPIAPRSIDENLYKDCSQAERYLNMFEQYRRVVTYYEKTASSFVSFVYLASAMILLI
jgi:transposase